MSNFFGCIFFCCCWLLFWMDFSYRFSWKSELFTCCSMTIQSQPLNSYAHNSPVCSYLFALVTMLGLAVQGSAQLILCVPRKPRGGWVPPPAPQPPLGGQAPARQNRSSSGTWWFSFWGANFQLTTLYLFLWESGSYWANVTRFSKSRDQERFCLWLWWEQHKAQRQLGSVYRWPL